MDNLLTQMIVKLARAHTHTRQLLHHPLSQVEGVSVTSPAACQSQSQGTVGNECVTKSPQAWMCQPPPATHYTKNPM